MKAFIVRRYIGYLILGSLCFSCQPANEKYNIAVKNLIDLGAVTVGNNINFAIDLLNPTDQDLTIMAVKGSCECIIINTYPSVLKPRQNGTINATYTSKFERKLAGVLYKDVVIQLNKKPFLHAVKLRVDVK
ncbi:DUF1573 domain-containing protein [Fibrella arboris]|uniref:DUF1573 domain-containing protein n=1 Tax=Fibrella arboris TaxID=3242486 RepID=UPI003521EA7E